MMNKKEVQTWVRSIVEGSPNRDPERYMKHIVQVYDLTECVLGNILKKYPNIPINFDEVILASGLHDIGRPLNKDQIFHELRGAKYIDKVGFKKDIADSLKGVYRISQMFRSHGFVSECWNDPELAEKKKEFEPLDPLHLVPTSWQEAIVTYCDLASLEGERVSIEERMTELFDRYKENPIVTRNSKKALNRVLELGERVEALEQGRLTEQDIARYGFLIH